MRYARVHTSTAQPCSCQGTEVTSRRPRSPPGLCPCRPSAAHQGLGILRGNEGEVLGAVRGAALGIRPQRGAHVSLVGGGGTGDTCGSPATLTHGVSHPAFGKEGGPAPGARVAQGEPPDSEAQTLHDHPDPWRLKEPHSQDREGQVGAHAGLRWGLGRRGAGVEKLTCWEEETPELCAQDAGCN